MTIFSEIDFDPFEFINYFINTKFKYYTPEILNKFLIVSKFKKSYFKEIF